jgi:hypothetical protein
MSCPVDCQDLWRSLAGQPNHFSPSFQLRASYVLCDCRLSASFEKPLSLPMVVVGEAGLGWGRTARDEDLDGLSSAIPNQDLSLDACPHP